MNMIHIFVQGVRIAIGRRAGRLGYNLIDYVTGIGVTNARGAAVFSRET